MGKKRLKIAINKENLRRTNYAKAGCCQKSYLIQKLAFSSHLGSILCHILIYDILPWKSMEIINKLAYNAFINSKYSTIPF